jgi:hypothetical protein
VYVFAHDPVLAARAKFTNTPAEPGASSLSRIAGFHLSPKRRHRHTTTPKPSNQSPDPRRRAAGKSARRSERCEISAGDSAITLCAARFLGMYKTGLPEKPGTGTTISDSPALTVRTPEANGGRQKSRPCSRARRATPERLRLVDRAIFATAANTV